MITPRGLPALKRPTPRIHPSEIPQLTIIIMRPAQHPRARRVQSERRDDLRVVFEDELVRRWELVAGFVGR